MELYQRLDDGMDTVKSDAKVGSAAGRLRRASGWAGATDHVNKRRFYAALCRRRHGISRCALQRAYCFAASSSQVIADGEGQSPVVCNMPGVVGEERNPELHWGVRANISASAAFDLAHIPAEPARLVDEAQ